MDPILDPHCGIKPCREGVGWGSYSAHYSIPDLTELNQNARGSQENAIQLRRKRLCTSCIMLTKELLYASPTDFPAIHK